MQPITFAIQLMTFSLASGQAPWDSIPFQEPIPARSLFCLGDRLWVGDDAGLRESRDAGESWRSIEPLPGDYGVYGLYMADSFQLILRSDAIYRTTDFGRTWQRAEADPAALNGNRFRAEGDSLFLESHSTQPGDRSVSIDKGRSWVSLGYWPAGRNADSVTPAPKFGLRIAGANLSQSVDGGTTWKPAPWQAPLGTPIMLTADSGNAYVLSAGRVLRRRGQAETWDFLQPSLQAASALQLAACGRNLCAATSFAISCSSDGGRHFRIMGGNPFPKVPRSTYRPYLSQDFSMVVDQDRLYLSYLDYSGPNFLWQRSLADSGTWNTLRYSPNDSVVNMIPAARQGLLVLFTSAPNRLVLVSTDQGQSFRDLPALPPGQGTLNVASLAKDRWALMFNLNLELSSDSGRTWVSFPYRGSSFPVSMSVTDSEIFTGGSNRFDSRDSSWTSIKPPGTLLVATDSVLYSAAPGTIWSQRLVSDPTASLGQRAIGRRSSPSARLGFGFLPEGPVRDALGKREPNPAKRENRIFAPRGIMR